MKILKFLLVFSFIILMYSCSNNDDDKIYDKLNTEVLQQTVWKGDYVIKEEGKVPYHCDVTLFFIDETQIEFTETRNNFFNQHRMDYTADDKMIVMINNGGSPQLAGNWLLNENTKDKLVFIKNMGTENYTMTLSRIYNAKYKLNTNILKQTLWKGSYINHDPNSDAYICNVNLLFESDKKLQFTETKDNFNNEHTTNYTANGNLLSIENNGGSPQLSGHWLVTEMSDNKLVMEKGLGNDRFNYKMILNKE